MQEENELTYKILPSITTKEVQILQLVDINFLDYEDYHSIVVHTNDASYAWKSDILIHEKKQVIEEHEINLIKTTDINSKWISWNQFNSTSVALTHGNINSNHLYVNSNNLITKLINDYELQFVEYKPKFLYYDIETIETSNYSMFPKVESRSAIISIISLYDTYADEQHIFTYDSYIINRSNIVIHRYKTEKDICRNFILYLKRYDGLYLLCSFNGSLGRLHEITGYDLPFIWERCRWLRSKSKLIKKRGFRNINNKFDDVMITQISFLPNIYLYDYSYIHTELGKARSLFDDYSLQSYLDYFDAGKKLDSNFSIQQLQEILHNAITDQTDITMFVDYCMMDSVLLHKLELKSNFITNKLSFSIVCNTPLHQCLYSTPGSITLNYLLQKLHKAGYLVQSSAIKDKIKYKGAYTLSVAGMYRDVIQFDVLSMYPNIAIANNISPETIMYNNSCHVKRDRKYTIDLEETILDQSVISFVDDYENDVYSPGVLPLLFLELLNKRKEIKKEMKLNNTKHEYLNRLQLTYKLAVNSLYGKLGSNYSVLYNVLLSASITAYGCMFIQHISNYLIKRGNETIFVDTDGICIKINKTKYNSYNDFKDLLIRLNKFANKFSTYLNFEVEDKDFYARIYIPKAHKSYLYLNYVSPEYMFSSTSMESINLDSFYINGIQWSLYPTPLMRNIIKKFFFEVLYNEMNSEDIKIHLSNFINEHYRIMRDILSEISYYFTHTPYNDITSCQCIEDLRHYSKRTKLGTAKGKILSTKFNLQGKVDWFISIYGAKRMNKTDLLIPLSDLDQLRRWIKYINILPMIEMITSPIKKFFMKPDKAELLRWKHNINNYNEDICNILYRKETLHSNSDYYSLHYMLLKEEILNNRDCSYHEMIEHNYNRAFFDIDDIDKTFDIIEFQQYICNTLSYHGKIGIACASSDIKTSYHITLCDLIIELGYNKIIAQQYNATHDRAYCDTSIYSINKSLRLPLSPKLSNGSFVRPLELVDKSDFEDVLIKNIFDVDITETPFYLNDNPIFSLPNMRSVFEDNELDIIETYAKNNNMTILSTDTSLIRARFDTKCLLCNKIHEHDNQFFFKHNNVIMLNCHRNRERDKNEQSDPIIVGTIMNNKHIRSFSEIMNNKLEDIRGNIDIEFGETCYMKYIEFDIHETRQTYVSSALGTGKTECLIKQIKETDTILIISFRRTFASDISRRFTVAGLPTVNYLDEERDEYNNRKYKRLCLQIDSIHKYHAAVKVDVLVCDEIESIFSQLLMAKDMNGKVMCFMQELTRAKRIVFMDGHLNQSTIDLIQYLTNYPTMRLYINLYKPKKEYRCIIKPINYNGLDYEVFLKLRDYLLDGKKVACMCSSQTQSSTIYQLMKGYYPSIKIKYYSGDDGDIIKELEISQRKQKYIDFNLGINEVVNNIDLLLYTSTLTGGVSIDIDYFDHFIGLFYARTCDVLSFLQAIHRVRIIKSKTIEIYYQQVNNYEPCTMRQYNDRLHLEDIKYYPTITHVEMFLKVRSIAMSVYSCELLLKHLDLMGYNMSFVDADKELQQDELITHELYRTTFRDMHKDTEIKSWLTTDKRYKFTEKYYKLTSDDYTYDRALMENKDPKLTLMYRIRTLTKYASLKYEEIINPDIFNSAPIKGILLRVLENIDLYRRLYFGMHNPKDTSYDAKKHIDSINSIRDEFNLSAIVGMIPEDTKRTIKSLNEARMMSVGYELIKVLQVGREYNKNEFVEIITNWIETNKLDIKTNNMLVSYVNKYICLHGVMFETKQRRINNDKSRFYQLNKM